jgi:UDP-GlcNAc:undecaprenyl-phosphate GlcNAc-1-phosphate transferase
MVTLLVPIVTLGLPIADTLLAMGRRALRGRPLFSADKEHIHHRLLAKGLSQKKAVLVLYGACSVLTGAALLLSFANSTQAALILGALCILFVLAVRRLGFFRLDRASAVHAARRRNRQLRDKVRAVSRQMAGVQDVEELWELVAPLRDELGAARMTLSLRPVGRGRESILHYSVGTTEEGVRPYVATIDVRDDLGSVGALVVHWLDGRSEIDRDDEIALELLCDHLAEAHRRLASAGQKAAPFGRRAGTLRSL